MRLNFLSEYPLALQLLNASYSLQGIRFVDGVVRSSQGNGVWTPLQRLNPA